MTCPASVTYTGSAQTPCTATVTGAGGLNQAPTRRPTRNNTNAGTATASASYAGDANHTGSSDSETFTIAKASSTTTVTCPASVTYTGVGADAVHGHRHRRRRPQPDAAPSPTPNNTNAGTATASATYAGDANHTGSSDCQDFTIDKAGSTTTRDLPGRRHLHRLGPDAVHGAGDRRAASPVRRRVTRGTPTTPTRDRTPRRATSGDANHLAHSDSTSSRSLRRPRRRRDLSGKPCTTLGPLTPCTSVTRRRRAHLACSPSSTDEQRGPPPRPRERYAGDANLHRYSDRRPSRSCSCWDGFLQPINDTAHQTGSPRASSSSGRPSPRSSSSRTPRARRPADGAARPSPARDLGPATTRGPEAVPRSTPDAVAELQMGRRPVPLQLEHEGPYGGRYRIFANLADGTPATWTSASRSSPPFIPARSTSRAREKAGFPTRGARPSIQLPIRRRHGGRAGGAGLLIA